MLQLPSFWMGGFEGADHINGAGQALDMVRATGHDRCLDADYRNARRLGLRCVRESIGWRLSERPGGGEWDLGRAVRMAQAARRQGVHILWTLMHYGVPDDLTLMDPALAPRFARFAGEVARVLAPLCPGPRFYTPINEISFLSWAASATCDMGPAGAHPCEEAGDTCTSGFVIKQRLVHAALAGMAAIRAVDPQARFLHVEPVVHVAPRDVDSADDRLLAQRIAAYQWQTFDMLAGRMEPQLGGHADALDWLGLNHYHTSQWEVPGDKRLPWHLRDPRRMPLCELLNDVWRRYRRPLILAETGHIGVGRAAWLHEVAGEARRARARGVPLQGVCLYPLLDRPDWNDTQRWHRSGLWHVAPHEADDKPSRSLNRPYARALLSWRGVVDTPRAPATHAMPLADDAPPAPGLLVLLPCPWEDWHAPRERLLDAWRAHGVVRVLEPPRDGRGEAVLRQHTLAPDAELLVLHGGRVAAGMVGTGAGGWADVPDPSQLALLAQALAGAGPRRWAAWLTGWRVDSHPGWWRELATGGLVVQPDAHRPPGAELMRRARARLPADWPGLVCAPRQARPDGYDDEEVSRLLARVPWPRVWMTVPQRDAAALDKLARRLRAAAWRQPGLQLVIDAAEPHGDEPPPPNLHWIGPVHDSLHGALAARMQGIVRWDGLPPDGGRGVQDHVLRPEQLADMVAHVLQSLAHPAPVAAGDARVPPLPPPAAQATEALSR